MIPWPFLNLLGTYVLVPCFICIIRISVLCFTNTFFHFTSLNKHLDIFFLPTAAFVIALINQAIFYSIPFVLFVGITAVIFGLILHVAIHMAKTYTVCTANTIIKLLLALYSLISFRFSFTNEHYDEYLIIYIVMCMKLLCVAEYLDLKRYETLMEESGPLNLQTYEAVAYIFYSGWISYKDFMLIGKKMKQSKCQCWFHNIKAYFLEEYLSSKTLHLALYKTVMFKIMSHTFVNLGEGYILRIISLLIQAFQFRCKYYLLCQYSQFERVTSGLKKNCWNRNTLYHFKTTETTIALRDFLSSICLPINGYIRRKFGTTTFEDQLWNLIHFGVICFALVTYNVYYAILVILFIFSLFTQRNSLESMATKADTCLFSCGQKICFHTFGRKHRCFYLVKALLVVGNNIRFAIILPSLPSSDVSFSLTLVILGLFFDLYLIIVAVLHAEANPEPGQLYIRRGRFYRRRNPQTNTN